MDMTKLIGDVCEYANTPKKCMTNMEKLNLCNVFELRKVYKMENKIL